jgi:hypothetical protein
MRMNGDLRRGGSDGTHQEVGAKGHPLLEDWKP